MIGEKAVPMIAFASCNIYYKRVFSEDPFVAIASANDDGSSSAPLFSFAQQMGYIMARMASANGDRAKLNKMSFDDYVDWLEDFAVSDMLNAMPDIMALYNGQQNTMSKEKKEDT